MSTNFLRGALTVLGAATFTILLCIILAIEQRIQDGGVYAVPEVCE